MKTLTYFTITILLLCESTLQDFYTGDEHSFYMTKENIKRFIPKKKMEKKREHKRKYKRKREKINTTCFEDEVANFQGCVDNLVNAFKKLSGGQDNANRQIKEMEIEIEKLRERNRNLIRENKELNKELGNIEVTLKKSFKKREMALIEINEQLKVDLDSCQTEFQKFKAKVIKRKKEERRYKETCKREKDVMISRRRNYQPEKRYRRQEANDDIVLGMAAPE